MFWRRGHDYQYPSRIATAVIAALWIPRAGTTGRISSLVMPAKEGIQFVRQIV